MSLSPYNRIESSSAYGTSHSIPSVSSLISSPFNVRFQLAPTTLKADINTSQFLFHCKSTLSLNLPTYSLRIQTCSNVRLGNTWPISNIDLDPLPFARTLLCTPQHQPTQSLDTYCSLRLRNHYLSLVKPPCQVRLQLRLHLCRSRPLSDTFLTIPSPLHSQMSRGERNSEPLLLQSPFPFRVTMGCLAHHETGSLRLIPFASSPWCISRPSSSLALLTNSSSQVHLSSPAFLQTLFRVSITSSSIQRRRQLALGQD